MNQIANALTVLAEDTQSLARQIKSVLGFQGSDPDLALFATIANRAGLDPFQRQIYAVHRGGRMTIQVGIDGYRKIAFRAGLDAIDEPEFGPETNGRPAFAKIRVWRKGSDRPTVGVAYWDEFAQRDASGKPTGMWARMPRTMLAKCAEAQALRKAFPEALSGLYTEEEMAQADNAARATVSVSEPKPVVAIAAPKPASDAAEYFSDTKTASADAVNVVVKLIDAINKHGNKNASVAAIEAKKGKRLGEMTELEIELISEKLTAMAYEISQRQVQPTAEEVR
jgi:phage recombination protein Bet